MNLVWKHLPSGPIAGRCTERRRRSFRPCRLERVFLLEKYPPSDSVAHGDLVGCAAEAGDVDALGADALAS